MGFHFTPSLNKHKTVEHEVPDTDITTYSDVFGTVDRTQKKKYTLHDKPSLLGQSDIWSGRPGLKIVAEEPQYIIPHTHT